MRKFIFGLLLGLSVAATPTLASWDMTDYALMKKIYDTVLNLHTDLQQLNTLQQKSLAAQEWQARSLQRMVWVLERQFPVPPEAKTP